MLEIGQYFRISQNGIDDKKSGTDGVVQSKNTRKNVNLSKTQNSKKKKKKKGENHIFTQFPLWFL